MRLRAIACALFYGIAPWQLYESSSHYAPMGYFEHLFLNLGLALRWLTFGETAEDRSFELEVNSGERVRA